MTKDELVEAIDQRCSSAAFAVAVARLGEIKGRLETLICNNAPIAEQPGWIKTVEQFIMDCIDSNS